MDSNNKRYKHLKPPPQRLIYEHPLTNLIIDIKIKLKTDSKAFIFVLHVAKPYNIFVFYNNKIIRLNKLLIIYTKELNIREQFIKLLQYPVLIENHKLTVFTVEAIYILHILLDVDLTNYINYISLNNLITYYFANKQ